MITSRQLSLIREVGQDVDFTIIFENYQHVFTRYQRFRFTKSIESIKSLHKVQVQFIETFTISKKLKSLYHECLASYRDMERGKKIYYLILTSVMIVFIFLCIFVIPAD